MRAPDERVTPGEMGEPQRIRLLAADARNAMDRVWPESGSGAEVQRIVRAWADAFQAMTPEVFATLRFRLGGSVADDRARAALDVLAEALGRER